jgi:hypothetical protein
MHRTDRERATQREIRRQQNVRRQRAAVRDARARRANPRAVSPATRPSTLAAAEAPSFWRDAFVVTVGTLLTAAICAVILFGASLASAEAREPAQTLKDMFTRFGLPFTDTPAEPTAPAAYMPLFIDSSVSDGAIIDDAPLMYATPSVGDLAFIVVEADGTNVPTVAGWTATPCSGQTTTGSGSYMFYQILADVNPTRLIAINAGDHIAHFMFGIKAGTFDAADPFEDACAQADLGTTGSLASTGIAIVNANSLVITKFTTARDANATGWLADVATDGAEYDQWTEAAGVHAGDSYIKNIGTGGGNALVFGVMQTAGTSGSVTATATADYHTVMTIAVNGATP